MRNGTYGRYHGKEYEIIEDMGWDYNILTQDPALIDETFKDTYHSGVYTKVIKPTDLSATYSVSSYVIYKGEQFSVRLETKDSIIIGTGNCDIAEKLHFERVDKYYSELSLPKEEVEVKENIEEIKLK